MKTLADIKRRCQAGVTLTMIEYKVRGVPTGGILVGVPRKVQVVQTNAIAFEPAPGKTDCSWLQWPKAADVKIVDADTFCVGGDDQIQMTYRFS